MSRRPGRPPDDPATIRRELLAAARSVTAEGFQLSRAALADRLALSADGVSHRLARVGWTLGTVREFLAIQGKPCLSCGAMVST